MWNPRCFQFPEAVERMEEGKLTQRVSAFQSNSQHCHCTHNRYGCDGCAYDANTALCLGIHGVVERLIAGIQVADVKIAEVQATKVLDDVPIRRTFTFKDRHPKIAAEELSARRGIGSKQPANTICITTQLGTRSAIMPITRCYAADRVFERPLLRGNFYTDTMDGQLKSLDGNKNAQIFATTKDLFVTTYPMESKSMAGEGLRKFIHDYERAERPTFDGSKEQCGKRTEFKKNVRRYSINNQVTEPDRLNHNAAEGGIREIWKKCFRTRRAQPIRKVDRRIC